MSAVNANNGCIYYNLRLNKNKCNGMMTHILVAYAFVKNPNPKGFRSVKHIDGNRLNNKADNLKWCESYKIKRYDITIDGSELERIADDEQFAVAKTDKAVYEGYLISNYGRLFSRYTNKFINGTDNMHGYLHYSITDVPIAAHRLVGFSFVENPDKEKFDRINHKDENRLNNYYKNLEWCDNDYNLSYNGANQRYERFVGRKVSQSDKNGKIIAIHDSMTAAAKIMGVNMSSVRCWCGKNRMYRGFYWKLVA
jgi:hypothetical protein